MNSLSKKYWEQPTKIKDGYLNEVSVEENKPSEPIKFMEIRNGRIVAWR